ncbi:MAG: 1-deoxy-D-xylulose-5-phosphate reductoisomerase [Pseudomonadota bacterium]
MSEPRRISIFGSTGSIGRSALSVVAHANTVNESPVFAVDTLVAGRDAEGLAEQAITIGAKHVVLADETGLERLRSAVSGRGITAAAGQTAIIEAARRPVDRLLAAIVGIAGLPSTLAALQAGISVALANKESMVCAGPLLNAIANKSGAAIVPTDSEHNAMFQVMERRSDVERLILTASGGPFRTASLEVLQAAKPEDALAHPRWSMGQKISIDSATLFNKGLELIEACFLFDIPEDRVDVVVHPQSTIHSLVSYRDGSVLAQMGEPDMRTPIAHALTWPERRQPTPVKRLDLIGLGQLDFEALDTTRFPAVSLARHAIRLGGGAPTVLNCANEGAVAAFLAGHLRFTDISWVVEQALERFVAENFDAKPLDSLQAVEQVQARAEHITRAFVADAAARV